MKECKLSENEKLKLHLDARQLAIAMMALLFVLYAFYTFSKAWFSQLTSIKATGGSVSIIQAVGKSFHIYKWDWTAGAWQTEPIDRIDLELSVPNETERYKIVCENPLAEISSVELSLAVFTTPTGTDDELYDFITVNKVDDPGGAGETSQLISRNTPGFQYTIPGDGANEAVIEIYIDKSVCNYYEEWSVTGTVTVE